MVTWEEWAAQVNKDIQEIKNRLNYEAKRIDTAFGRFNKIENELVRHFFLEKMQAYIIESLRHGPKTHQEIMKPLPAWETNHMLHSAFYDAWKAFEKAGVILPISHGRGYARTWELSLTKEDAKHG